MLDPFEVPADTFELNPVNGEIAPSSSLADDDPIKAMAKATIRRLDLNAQETKAMRAGHVSDFLERHVTADYLRRHSPFVAYELSRQGLLGDDANQALPINT